MNVSTESRLKQTDSSLSIVIYVSVDGKEYEIVHCCSTSQKHYQAIRDYFHSRIEAKELKNIMKNTPVPWFTGVTFP